MKKVFLNKYVVIIPIFFIFVGILIQGFTHNRHKLYTENKDNIVVLNATVSNITEKTNYNVDSSYLHEYTIALSYVYDGQLYVHKYWKDVEGNSYDDIYYKKGDTVEVVIFSHTPDEIVSDDPDDIELYLQKPLNVIPPSLGVAIISYVLAVAVCWVVQRKNNKTY